MTLQYNIVSVNSGLSLDVIGLSTTGGASIQQWSYWGSLNQLWNLIPVGDGSFKIVNVNSNLLLDVTGVSKTPGTLLQQWSDWGGANQHWNFVPVGDGSYKIASVDSGLLLDVVGVSTTPGALVQQWTDWGGLNQHWKLFVDGQQVSVPTTSDPITNPIPPPTPAPTPTPTPVPSPTPTPTPSSETSPVGIGGGADPSIVFFNGKYHMVQGDWGQNVFIYRSPTIGGLMQSEKFTYTNTVDSNYNAEAPDIGIITDPRDGRQKLGIYITKALPYPGTIKVVITSDPSQGFEDMGFLANVNGYDAHLMIHPNGNTYLLYSTFNSIQIIQLSNPWTSQGQPVTIATAYLPWELAESALNEAPDHVIINDTINVIYSVNTYNNPSYCCGLLTASVQSDPMNPGSWTKHSNPVFSSGNGRFGPGSVTFFMDAQNNHWMGYGSLPNTNTQDREIRAQTVSFDNNGVVQLGQPN